MTGIVLCTGVSGFLGGHVACQLLAAGYRVRGSVRRIAQASKVKASLDRAGADSSRLEFVELELLEDQGWSEAAQGCDHVVHTASPFVLTMPKNPDDLITPAVRGTRRAVDAALKAGVRRIVLTSSIAAIVYGHKDYSRVFTDADWTDLQGPHITAYIRSKTLAEQLAWSMVQQAGRYDALAVINPGAILGPLLDDDPGTTGGLIVRMMTGGVPAAPRVVLGWVDVRDVAAAHVAAMESPDAGGRRYIVSGENLSLMEVARILATEFPDHRRKLPRLQMPDWVVRVARMFDPALRDVASEIGPPKWTDPGPADSLLGRPLRPAAEAILATADSARAMGLL